MKRAVNSFGRQPSELENEWVATKVDVANVRTEIVELNGRIGRIETKMDAKFNLVIGLMSAFFIAFVVDKLIS